MIITSLFRPAFLKGINIQGLKIPVELSIILKVMGSKTRVGSSFDIAPVVLMFQCF